jgi:hypothetical protein
MQEAVVEVPLTAPNQQGVPVTAPAGEIETAINAVVAKFNGAEGLRIQKRNGMELSSRDIRSVETGAHIQDGFQATPGLFSSLETSVVVAADDHPHVLAENAESWSRYPYVYSPTVAKQHVVYGGNTSIAAPDFAEIDGVRFYVWSAPAPASTLNPFAPYIMAYVVDADGSPIRSPWKVWTGDISGRGKVVSDGTYFWLFTTVFGTVRATVFDTNGEQVDELEFEELDNDASPFDVTYQGGYVLYCQGNFDTVRVSRMTIAGSTISALTTDMSFHALGNHGVAWAENPDQDGNAYLLTSHHDPDGGTVEYAYRIGTIASSPTVTGYFDATAANGEIYEQDGEGGLTGRLCQMSGYFDGSVLYAQLGFMDATDHRMDRTVFIRAEIGEAPIVDTVLRGVRPASRTFQLPGTTKQMVMMYYPSTLTTVVPANGTTVLRPIAYLGQPTYFMVDIATAQTTGRFLDGNAGNEYTNTGYPAAGIAYSTSAFYFCLPSTVLGNDDKLRIPLGYNAETVNTIETVATGSDIQRTRDVIKQANAVNIMGLTFGGYGQALEYNSELLMPGALTTSFTGFDFSEQGISLAPEQATLTRSTSTGALTLLGIYDYVIVFEWTDPNGRRVRSAPSIPQYTTLTGTQNTITLEIVVNHMTNRPDLSVSIYRTYYESGVPSTIHRKVTNDLFPLFNDKDDRTVTFIDTVSDAQCSVNEMLYTDMGLLNRDAAPASASGCVGDNRVFLVGPDNAVWYSGEANDTDPLWFNRDVQRLFVPTNDELLRVEFLDGRLILFCARSIWFVPGGRWPGGNGLDGAVQAPTRLGVNNGCNGWTQSTKYGIAYSSSAGGVWMLTRGLENEQLGANAVDDFNDDLITGITVDDEQRIQFSLQGQPNVIMVFDTISKVWTKWTMPTDVTLTHTIRGRFAYVDNDGARTYGTGYFDSDAGGFDVWYTMDVTVPFSISNIKGLKRIWEYMLSGERMAACSITVDATYTTEDLDVSESWTFSPAVGERFEYDFQPKQEEMTKMTLRLIDAPQDGETEDENGNSFAWDLTSFTVGTEGGLSRTPPTTRRKAST